MAYTIDRGTHRSKYYLTPPYIRGTPIWSNNRLEYQSQSWSIMNMPIPMPRHRIHNCNWLTSFSKSRASRIWAHSSNNPSRSSTLRLRANYGPFHLSRFLVVRAGRKKRRYRHVISSIFITPFEEEEVNKNRVYWHSKAPTPKRSLHRYRLWGVSYETDWRDKA